MSPGPGAGPLSLTPTGEPGSALWEDRRCGFSMIVPGSPRRLAPGERAPVPGEPTYDALLAVTELPVELGLRLSEVPPGMDPALLCVTVAGAYARNRCDGAPPAVPADDARRHAYGVAGAATAWYPLSAAAQAPGGADSEEVTVLAHGDRLMTITRRFAQAGLDRERWLLFNAAVTGSMRWGPGQAERPSRLWPEGPFLLPGLGLQLKEETVRELRPLLRRVTTPPPGRLPLRLRLDKVLRGGEAPWEPVTAEVRQAVGAFLSDVCVEPALREVIEAGMGLVHTAHDLRGLATLLLREL